MKKTLFSLLLILPIAGFAQNLLLNGGFEDENICTEYKINCAPDAWISSASSALYNYFKDANRAFEGEHCMSIEAGHATRPYERTFIRSPLLCRLKKGNKYRLEMYVKSLYPILDSAGVYFGPIDPLLERKPIHLLAPSLFLASANKFVKDSSWQKATLDYTANGDERFITIANFSRNDIKGYPASGRLFQFLIFLDKISLVPLDPGEGLCANWQEVKQDIYDQNERHQYLQRILINRQTDPLKIVQPGPMLSALSDSLVLPDVLFATGNKELRSASFAVLDSFCKKMNGKIIDSLVIEGHADNTGTNAFNEQLSAGRAEAAASYLRSCAAFIKTTILIRGHGSRQPIAANDTPANRQRNRRVELVVYFRG